MSDAPQTTDDEREALWARVDELGHDLDDANQTTASDWLYREHRVGPVRIYRSRDPHWRWKFHMIVGGFDFQLGWHR